MPKSQQQQEQSTNINLSTTIRQRKSNNLEIEQEVIRIQQPKPWSWHFKLTSQFFISSLAILGFTQIPMALTRPIGGYTTRGADDTSSELLHKALIDRRTQPLQACVNSTAANSQLMTTQGSTPMFLNNGDQLVVSYTGPTSTAYPGIYGQILDGNNHPLTNTQIVSTGTWTKANNFVIKTESSLVYCWNTVTVGEDVFCESYTNALQVNGTTLGVAYYSGYNQLNVRGSARYGGGFEVVFQSNGIDNNSTHYQIFLRGYQPDNVTPIGAAGTGAELRVSTVTNSNNINGQVINQKDNSGAVIWQRKLAGSLNNEILMRRYNNSTSARAFTDTVEVSVTAATLLNYDCLNPQVATIKDVNDNILGYKLVFMATPSGGYAYNLYIQDLDANLNLIGSPSIIAPAYTLGSGAPFGLMPKDDGGVRIALTSSVPGPYPQMVTIELFANNTLDGAPMLVDPQSNQIQVGGAITSRGNGRYTVGFACDSGVCQKTFSGSPFMTTPVNISLPAAAGTAPVKTSIPGFAVEPVTYPRSWITVVLSGPSDIVTALNTNAAIPANATVTSSSSNGVSTLTMTTTGGHCDADIDNLLACLTADLQPYDRDGFNINATVTDSSGLSPYQISVPVSIDTSGVVYSSIVSQNQLAIGQNNTAYFNLNVTTQDNSQSVPVVINVPPDQQVITVSNFAPSAAKVNLINPVTKQVVQSNIASFTMLDQLQGKVLVQSSPAGGTPDFQLTARTYNGPVSLPSDTAVQYFYIPQILLKQITYTAKTPSDQTPLLMDSSNFLAQDANTPDKVIYHLIYGQNPIGNLALASNPNQRISQYSQAYVNSGDSICFIPIEGGTDDILVYVDDGYTACLPVSISYKYNVLQQTTDNAGNPATNNALNAAQGIGGALAGVLFTRWAANKARHLKNCFANLVYQEGKLSYWNFFFTDGNDYQKMINKLLEQTALKDTVEGLVDQYSRNWCFSGPEGKELQEIVKIFAKELRNYLIVGNEDWQTYCTHLPTRLYYQAMGTPLKPELLDFEIDDADGRPKNTALIAGLSSSIMSAYASYKCPVEKQQSTNRLYIRMQTAGNLFNLTGSTPSSTSSSNGSKSSVSISMDTFNADTDNWTPEKARKK